MTKPLILKIVVAALILVNGGVWYVQMYGPQHDINQICKAFSELSHDRRSGVEDEVATHRLSENLDSLWTSRGRYVANAMTEVDPVFRRKELEKEAYELGIRFWSCPGIGFE